MKAANYHQNSFIACLSIVLLTALGNPFIAQAQSSSKSGAASNQQQANDRIADLQKQLDELKLRQQIRDAERAILTNSLPKVTSASEALEGKTAINGSTTAAGNTTFESQILAYQALQEIVKALASDVSKVNGISSIVILDEKSLKNLTAYQYYSYLYQGLFKAYEGEATRESVPSLAVLEVPTTLLRSVADFLALFRTDTTINNFQITLRDSSLAVQLSHQLRLGSPRPVRVLYPEWYAQDFATIQTQLQALLKAKGEAEKSLKAPPPNETEAEKEVRLNKSARLTKLRDEFDKLVAYVSTLDNLTTLSKGAKIADTLSQNGSHVLFFSLEAGGSNRTTRNLFSGTRTRHSGGVILNYALFNPEGEMTTSNSLYYHTGYVMVPTDKPITNIHPYTEK